MKIGEIKVFQQDLPYAGGAYHLSGGRTFTHFDATFVKLTTECGISGWGESTPFGATYIAAHADGVRAGLAEISPHLLGKDPRQIMRIKDTMDASLLGHAHAKTPLDVACWDIFGKAVGLPVCELLGGSNNQVLPLISSIPFNSPDKMRDEVQQFRDRGYRGHSLKIGSENGIEEDAECIKAALADQRADEFFIVDANGGFSVAEAKALLDCLPDELNFVFEAPCATLHETIEVQRNSRWPIFIDELATSSESVAEIIRRRAAEGIGLKISKNGGLTACRQQRDMCEAAGLLVSIQDTVGSEIAFAAIVHLAQSTPQKMLRCILDTRAMVNLSIASVDIKQQPGGVLAGDSPGLGLNVDEKRLGKPLAVYH